MNFLTRHFNSYILDQILSGDDAETVVERIHEYLKLMGENIRGSKVDTEDFIVFKVHIIFLLCDFQTHLAPV